MGQAEEMQEALSSADEALPKTTWRQDTKDVPDDCVVFKGEAPDWKFVVCGGGGKDNPYFLGAGVWQTGKAVLKFTPELAHKAFDLAASQVLG